MRAILPSYLCQELLVAVAFTLGRTRIDSVRLALVLGQGLTVELTSFIPDEVFRIAIIMLVKD